MRVYLDNAASTPLRPEVLEAMLPYLADQHGNPSSVHHHGRQLRAAIEKARKTVADLLGAAPAEIVFTSGGTEADNHALRQAVVAQGVAHIVTSPLEHHAITHTAEDLAARQGLRLTWLCASPEGHPDMAQLEAELAAAQARGERTLVSLMHGNNEIGTLADLDAIGALAHAHGALFHSDTVQTVGHLPFALHRQPVDFIVASAHKFYGPKGVGFLYRSERAQLPPLLTGGGQERNQRAGTENVAAIVGLARALELCYANLEAQERHLRGLKARAMAGLQAAIPGVAFNGDVSEAGSLASVLNVALPGTDDESLLLFNLDIAGISASGGSACTSGSLHPSHVLAALGCTPARMANSVRLSFGVQNTEAEVDYAVAKLAEFVGVPAKA